MNVSEEQVEQALVTEVSVILATDPSAVKPGVPLQDLGLDSMGFVEVLVFIEKTFQLKLVETGLAKEDFRTIQALARRITRELKG